MKKKKVEFMKETSENRIDEKVEHENQLSGINSSKDLNHDDLVSQ
jgi:hypothetical protein